MHDNILHFISLIIFLGQELEGEGNDRSTLSLPGQQLALLQEAVTSGNTCEGLFTRNEKRTDIQTIIFWVAWPQTDVFTINQFLSIYQGKRVTDPFAP